MKQTEWLFVNPVPDGGLSVPVVPGMPLTTPVDEFSVPQGGKEPPDVVQL